MTYLYNNKDKVNKIVKNARDTAKIHDYNNQINLWADFLISNDSKT